MNNEKYYNLLGGSDSMMLLISMSCSFCIFIIIIIILIFLYKTYYLADTSVPSTNNNNDKKKDAPILKVLTAWPPLTTPVSQSGTTNKAIVIFNIATPLIEPTPFEIVVSESYLAWGGSGAYSLIDNDKTTFWQSNYNVYFPGPGYNGGSYLGDATYKGEWFYLKLPKQISLVRYSIGFAGQGPATWKIYGSNDGTKWTEIAEAEQKTPINQSNFINNNYTIILKNPSLLYQYFGCVINSLFQTGGNYAAQVSDCRFYSME